MPNAIFNLESRLLLAWPEDITDKYHLKGVDQLKFGTLIRLFEESIDARSPEEAVAKLDEAYKVLGQLETFSSQKYLTLMGSLKKWEVEDYDAYFEVQREQTKNSSIFLLARSLLIAYKTFLDLRYFNQSNCLDDISLVVWKKYHWIFFIFLQGNILCILHLKKEMRKENLMRVGAILKSMSQLMWASGAAMLFAGGFQRQTYENEVRPTMMSPQVASPSFSGIMSYDHAFLIHLWNREKGIFKLIPPFLQSAHEEFLSAHEFLASAHKFVCHKYGGAQEGSLREKEVSALDNLEKINDSRRKLIINHHTQLLDSESRLVLKDERDYEEYIKIGFKCYAQLLVRSAS